ncbi:MAG: hypothetical protein CVV03_07600 [Firmicutes bacterium HGW-Firmicutes-8]|nr:MAG: hypothetical protein CVV03_07600 [Firmicutes bacterium HGW-Firmicutes-8]
MFPFLRHLPQRLAGPQGGATDGGAPMRHGRRIWQCNPRLRQALRLVAHNENKRNPVADSRPSTHDYLPTSPAQSVPILLPEPRALIDIGYYVARRSDKMGKPLARTNTPAPPSWQNKKAAFCKTAS